MSGTSPASLSPNTVFGVEVVSVSPVSISIFCCVVVLAFLAASVICVSRSGVSDAARSALLLSSSDSLSA